MCKTCFIELDSRNLEAAKVFMAVRNQYITIGAGYPVAVNVVAVEAVMDIYKIPERDQVFRRVTNVINKNFIPKLQKKFENK